MSQIEEEQKQDELRRAQAALLEKQEKNDKKKENEEFLDRLVIKTKTVVIDLIKWRGGQLVCHDWTLKLKDHPSRKSHREGLHESWKSWKVMEFIVSISRPKSHGI